MPRVAAPKTATNFLNSKKRVIYVSKTGKYFVTGSKGAAQYGVKAAFVKNGNSNKVLANFGGNVPNAIKPKTTRTRMIGPRMQRKNAGSVRGPRPLSNGAIMKAMFAEPKGYSRRPRSNKGVARGPRGPTGPRAVSNAAALKALFAEPKGYSRRPRKNKGVARGARGPTGPRWMPKNVTVLTV
jgi:hypothetical protein